MTSGKNIVKNCGHASIIGTSAYSGVSATASRQRREKPVPIGPSGVRGIAFGFGVHTCCRGNDRVGYEGEDPDRCAHSAEHSGAKESQRVAQSNMIASSGQPHGVAAARLRSCARRLALMGRLN
jgi:hypothetical protein